MIKDDCGDWVGCINRSLPVLSTTNDYNRKEVEPYINWINLNLCMECYVKITNLKCGFRGADLSLRYEEK